MKINILEQQERKIGVYKIENLINNKVYIGSTISGFKKRIKEHLYELNKGKHHSSHLQKAFNKYGTNNFEVSILEVCNRESIIQKEQFYLDQYKSYNRNLGYNILNKAYNSQGYKHTEENIILIGQMSKLRGPHPNSINAMRLANLGSKKDENHIIRMKEIHSKPVIQLDLQGNFIKRWNSITEAKLFLGLSLIDSNISKCCNKKCKSSNGFMWVKEVDYNSSQEYKYNPIINGVNK